MLAKYERCFASDTYFDSPFSADVASSTGAMIDHDGSPARGPWTDKVSEEATSRSLRASS